MLPTEEGFKKEEKKKLVFVFEGAANFLGGEREQNRRQREGFSLFRKEKFVFFMLW